MNSYHFDNNIYKKYNFTVHINFFPANNTTPGCVISCGIIFESILLLLNVQTH